MLYHAKICILGKNLYVSHTLFVLYLEGNHTLFGEKLYFIWKLSSGNSGEKVREKQFLMKKSGKSKGNS